MNPIDFFNNLATTTGQFITDSLPALWWFLGGAIAILALGIVFRGFTRALKILKKRR